MISEGNDADNVLCDDNVIIILLQIHLLLVGCWLGDSEKVVAPSNWFADSCAGKSVKDMEFSDWTWLTFIPEEVSKDIKNMLFSW